MVVLESLEIYFQDTNYFKNSLLRKGKREKNYPIQKAYVYCK